MKIDKEDYNRAVGCLKRYNYNCIKILNIRADIMSIGSPSMDGLPKAPNNISDNVFNTVIKLQEDEELQKCLREYKAVTQSIQLVDDIAKKIFEEEYQKGNTKWNIINKLHISESTYERRKSKLIYNTYKEIKSEGKLTEF